MRFHRWQRVESPFNKKRKEESISENVEWEHRAAASPIFLPVHTQVQTHTHTGAHRIFHYFPLPFSTRYSNRDSVPPHNFTLYGMPSHHEQSLGKALLIFKHKTFTGTCLAVSTSPCSARL